DTALPGRAARRRLRQRRAVRAAGRHPGRAGPRRRRPVRHQCRAGRPPGGTGPRARGTPGPRRQHRLAGTPHRGGRPGGPGRHRRRRLRAGRTAGPRPHGRPGRRRHPDAPAPRLLLDASRRPGTGPADAGGGRPGRTGLAVRTGARPPAAPGHPVTRAGRAPLPLRAANPVPEPFFDTTPERPVMSTMSTASRRSQTDPLDLLAIDDLLTSDEKAVRASVRQVCDASIEPYIADWFERGELPVVRELAKELGGVGLLGMHLEGYGCAGMSAVDYGLACLELEATDSGIRSLVSVQGSLAMYAIWRHGSEEQKQEWLPRMAAGEAIGCFGLTEPDHGSDPAGM